MVRPLSLTSPVAQSCSRWPARLPHYVPPAGLSRGTALQPSLGWFRTHRVL